MKRPLITWFFIVAGCGLLITGLGGGLTGCVRSEPASTSTEPPLPSPVADPAYDEVLVAYFQMWRAIHLADLVDGEVRRRELLAAVLTDPILSEHVAGLGRDWDAGIRVSGGQTLPVSQRVEVANDTARVEICVDESARIVTIPGERPRAGPTRSGGHVDFVRSRVGWRARQINLQTGCP